MIFEYWTSLAFLCHNALFFWYLAGLNLLKNCLEFWIYVHEGYWLTGVVVVRFSCQDDSIIIEWVGNAPLFSVFYKGLNKTATVQAQISWVPLVQGLSQECSQQVSYGCPPSRLHWGKSASKVIHMAVNRTQKIYFQAHWQAVIKPQVLAGFRLDTSVPCHVGLSKEKLTRWQVSSLRVSDWNSEKDPRRKP